MTGDSSTQTTRTHNLIPPLTVTPQNSRPTCSSHRVPSVFRSIRPSIREHFSAPALLASALYCHATLAGATTKQGGSYRPLHGSLTRHAVSPALPLSRCACARARAPPPSRRRRRRCRPRPRPPPWPSSCRRPLRPCPPRRPPPRPCPRLPSRPPPPPSSPSPSPPPSSRAPHPPPGCARSPCWPPRPTPCASG